jgi:hypothetical protein
MNEQHCPTCGGRPSLLLHDIEVNELRQRVAELEIERGMLSAGLGVAQGLTAQLAACEKERDELRELAKWREKYCLTGSPEIYDNQSQEFHKWACETHDAIKEQKVGADETATCIWWEGDDGDPWATQCNELFNIENEGPEANGMKFCCFCGKKLVEVRDETKDEYDECDE